MFNATKNRRRFSAGATQKSAVQISGARCESLESRQLLTAVTVAPEDAAVSVDVNAEESDAVFAEMGDAAMQINFDGMSTSQGEVSAGANSATTAAFVSHASMEGSVAANVSALPAPPTVPAGLGSDIHKDESDAVAEANDLHESITELHKDKAECLTKVAAFEKAVADAKTALDDATADQQTKQDSYDKAVQDAADADANLKTLKTKLQELKTSLRDANRAQNQHTRAINYYSRQADKARRQSNRRGISQAQRQELREKEANDTRQVDVNYRAYQEKAAEARSLKQQIKAVSQQITEAKQAARVAKAAVAPARRALNAAKRATATAQSKHDKAVADLKAAKEECDKLCEKLETEEAKYLGTATTKGALEKAEDAIKTAEQRKQDRLDQEAKDEQDRKDDAEVEELRKKNKVVKLDLEAPDGKNKEDITPDDITRLVGQQGDDSIPSDQSGIELAEAAAIKALEAKTTGDALSYIGNLLLSVAWDRLKGIIPVLATLDTLLQKFAGFDNFLEGIQNGDLKYQRDVWTPEWGTIITQTIYNCRTGQYITVTQVLFYHPSLITGRAGGVGRDGIFIPDHVAGQVFTITHFGTVNS